MLYIIRHVCVCLCYVKDATPKFLTYPTTVVTLSAYLFTKTYV